MRKIEIAVTLLMVSGVPAAARAQVPVQVPTACAAPVMVDGYFDAGEWNGAATIAIEGSFGLHVKECDGLVYLALRMDSPTPRPIDVYVVPEDGRIHQLHASMATGERSIPGTPWSDDAVPWRWHRHRDWTANDAELDRDKPDDLIWSERLVPYDGVEYQIRRSRFAGERWRVRIEIGSFPGSEGFFVYPSGSTRENVGAWAEFRLPARTAAR